MRRGEGGCFLEGYEPAGGVGLGRMTMETEIPADGRKSTGMGWNGLFEMLNDP